MGLGRTLVKIGIVAGAAYGGYYLYKKYVKKDGVAQKDYDDLADVSFNYDEDAADEKSFADRIKAAAERQFDKIK